MAVLCAQRTCKGAGRYQGPVTGGRSAVSSALMHPGQGDSCLNKIRFDASVPPTSLLLICPWAGF